MKEELRQSHNVEAEQQVLGALLMNNALYDKVSDILLEDHFFDPVHRRIFQHCSARIQKGHLVSPVTLKAVFESDEGLKELGGVGYLVRMQAASISSSQVREYAALVIDTWQRRQLADASRGAIQRIFEGEEIPDISNDLEGTITTLQANSANQPYKRLDAAVSGMVEELVEAYQKERDPGISTGYPSLDNLLGGLAGGDMMVLAGTTSMGKTTVGMAICDKIAQRGEAVAIISREMSEQSLSARLVSRASSVPYQDMRRASRLEQAQVRKIVLSAKEISELPIYVVPPQVRDVVAIHGAVRAIKSECAKNGQRLAAVMVDYLQLVVAPGRDRVEQVSNASRSLKSIATMLDVPVIALAQLSRNIANREDKRPILADLKDSSQIEQDADQVVFCHREHYWLEREKPPKAAELRADYEAALNESRGVIELIVGKNRHGALGTAVMKLDPATNTLLEKFGKDERQDGMDFV